MLDSSRSRTGVSPLRLLLVASCSVLLLWSSARLMLLVLHRDRLPDAATVFALLGTGLRVDLITLGALLALPVLILPLAAWRSTQSAWMRLSRIWMATLGLAAVVLELISPAFIGEYELRPNHLALDYLASPREVLSMLWSAFRLPLLVGGGTLLAGTIVGLRWIAAPVLCPDIRRSALLMMWPLLILATVMMIRSSFDHRPANPALFARWSDALLNQLALNSSYSFGHAVYARRHERDVGAIYGHLDPSILIAALRSDPRFAAAPSSAPTRRFQQPTRARTTPLNLIIVVEESLGADFSARLGGQGLTPNLDRWAPRGIWFERLYATGTRSARGLEAIVAGFPPSPAPSVLKRRRAQTGFATLGSVLQQQGYRTAFLYGGGSHFDNMRGFFLGNGVEQIIDEGDFQQPRFRGSWGVSDEDLFEAALVHTAARHAEGRPFFQLLFTSSNHTPFEFPPGRLTDKLAPPGTLQGAVRYADHALGGFLDAAQRAPWFAQTLILVVADHDIRVYGEDTVPLARFRVPGLIVGADITPMTIGSLASQIDLAPTLLSLMGVAARHPFPGRDLSATLPEFGVADGPTPRALMQFEDRYAHLEPGHLAVLHPGGRGEAWIVDASDQLRPTAPLDMTAQQTLLAEVSLPDWLYHHDAYGLEDEQKFMQPTAAREVSNGMLVTVPWSPP